MKQVGAESSTVFETVLAYGGLRRLEKFAEVQNNDNLSQGERQNK